MASTSKAMQARLAAQAAKVAGDDGDGDTADAAGLGLDNEGDDSPIVEAAVAAAEGKKPSPPQKESSPAPDEAKETRAARAKLYAEKFEQAREKRQAQRIRESAAEERRAAKADREAAAAEKAKYDALKTGTYREGLKALGRDPAKEFADMQREQIEASTPEGIARREKEAERAERAEHDAKIQARLDAVEAREKAALEREHASVLHESFRHAASDPAFADLRIEYPDDVLLDHAVYYDKNPNEFYQEAVRFGVRLTTPGKGFKMHEVLQVLSAAQAAHDSGKQARRAAQRPAEQQSAPPTVNGTAPRRNAGTAPGNELASERSTPSAAESAGLSPHDRMRLRARAEIRKAGG